MYTPLLDPLPLRTGLSSSLLLDLTVCDCDLDPGVHATPVCAQVSIAVRGDKKQSPLLCVVDPVFEFAWLAG